MTKLLPELALTLPRDAFDAGGAPDFHRLSKRMLHGDGTVAVTYFVFDVLVVEGLSTTQLRMGSGGSSSRSSTWNAAGCGWSRRFEDRRSSMRCVSVDLEGCREAAP